MHQEIEGAAHTFSTLEGLLTHLSRVKRYCHRVSTLAAYAEANRDATGEASHLSTHLKSYSSEVGAKGSVDSYVEDASVEMGQKTAVGAGSVVGTGCRLGDKCSVKKATIGMHCVIGSGVKISNSVIWNHVSIGDGCIIQNSIVCSNVSVEEHANIRDCYIGSSYVVSAGADHREETLTASSFAAGLTHRRSSFATNE